MNVLFALKKNRTQFSEWKKIFTIMKTKLWSKDLVKKTKDYKSINEWQDDQLKPKL